MSTIFQNAGPGSVSPIIRNDDAAQFILEANLGSGCVLAWEVSNITPYDQLTAQGATTTVQAFTPQDPDFVRAKTPSTNGLFYLNGEFRYMRVRVLSGVALYVGLTSSPFSGPFSSSLDTSDVETVAISYQMPDSASLIAYTGRSKVLWITTGASRGMYLRDDAGSSPTFTGAGGAKWFKIST